MSYGDDQYAQSVSANMEISRCQHDLTKASFWVPSRLHWWKLFYVLWIEQIKTQVLHVTCKDPHKKWAREMPAKNDAEVHERNIVC